MFVHRTPTTFHQRLGVAESLSALMGLTSALQHLTCKRRANEARLGTEFEICAGFFFHLLMRVTTGLFPAKWWKTLSLMFAKETIFFVTLPISALSRGGCPQAFAAVF